MKLALLKWLVLAVVLISQGASAEFISVFGTWIQDSNTIYEGEADPVDNLYDEDSPTWEYEVNSIPTITQANFGFFTIDSTHYLQFSFLVGGSDSQATLNGLSVIFSDFEFSDPLFDFESVVPENSDITGLTPAVNQIDGELVLSFSDYFVHESRSVILRFVDEDIQGSVVPVPAAAPMAILGLGFLALARRFRRKKS